MSKFPSNLSKCYSHLRVILLDIMCHCGCIHLLNFLSWFYSEFFAVLLIKDHVLCRKWTDKTAKERDQIVIPAYLTAGILEEAHGQVGHLGIAKTFEMVQRNFYWPGFFKVQ